MASFVLERTVNLPIEKLWSLLADFSKAPASDTPVTVLKAGDPKANGIGTIRKITIGRACVEERLESATPHSGFTYRVLSGAPMKAYLGTVSLKDVGGKTLVRWSAELTPKIPMTGAICSKLAKRVANLLIDSVVREHC